LTARIHVPDPLAENSRLALSQESAKHLRALRLRPGDPVRLFDGLGGEYTGEVLVLGKRDARVQVNAFVARECESPLSITLVQGVSKGERMDFTIQKAVELGVSSILPVFTERSIVQLGGERLDRRTRHWQSIAISACEQCGRNRVPSILPPSALRRALNELRDEVKLVLDPQGETPPHLPDTTSALTLLVGPEGGLSELELNQAQESGFLRWRLGPRILRTETAGMTALAVLQSRHGDLSMNGRRITPCATADAVASPANPDRE